MKVFTKVVALILTMTMVAAFAAAAMAEENIEQPAVMVVTEPVEASAPVASQSKPADVNTTNATPAPAVTEAPEAATAVPEATAAPEETIAPEETVAPEATTTPEEAAAPEETAAPEASEEPVPAEETLPEELPSEEPAIDLSNLTVTIQCLNGSHAQMGDTITLVAEVSGTNGAAYNMQWQYMSGGEWHDISGANASSYSYTLNEKNATYAWRMAITVD